MAIRLAVVWGWMLAMAFAGGARAQSPATAAAPEAQCAGLQGGRWAGLKEAATWVTRATYHPAAAGRRSYCEVEGYVNPTVGFAMALPAEGWNGKYMVKGCGSSCGIVDLKLYCDRSLRQGYACLQTDMGHRSSFGDNNWTANNLQGLVDYGYRATHVTTVAGKAIVEAYYGAPASRSYFLGCSTGARQALVEVQRFPLDFDAVVAVAPGNTAPLGVDSPPSPDVFNLGPGGKAILGDGAARRLHEAVVARCDRNDGVADGVVDARDCRFDPASLLCRGGPAAGCLTAEQVAVVRRFNAGGFLPGSELNWIGTWTADPPHSAYAMTQGRGDATIVDSLNFAGNPDLGAFAAHGGKLILAHGQSDTSALPLPVADYVGRIDRLMGAQARAGFMRYFIIPGMNHCSGGAGAWSIDYVAALDAWATSGVAPDRLIGDHPRDGSPAPSGIDHDPLAPEQVQFSRPHFAHPLVARYAGKGDPAQAGSFKAYSPRP